MQHLLAAPHVGEYMCSATLAIRCSPLAASQNQKHRTVAGIDSRFAVCVLPIQSGKYIPRASLFIIIDELDVFDLQTFPASVRFLHKCKLTRSSILFLAHSLGQLHDPSTLHLSIKRKFFVTAQQVELRVVKIRTTSRTK